MTFYIEKELLQSTNCCISQLCQHQKLGSIHVLIHVVLAYDI